jgi:hypothetical protein
VTLAEFEDTQVEELPNQLPDELAGIFSFNDFHSSKSTQFPVLPAPRVPFHLCISLDDHGPLLMDLLDVLWLRMPKTERIRRARTGLISAIILKCVH